MNMHVPHWPQFYNATIYKLGQFKDILFYKEDVMKHYGKEISSEAINNLK